MADIIVKRPVPTPWSVEIVTGPQHHPKQDTLSFRTTRKATRCRGCDDAPGALTGLNLTYSFYPYGGAHDSVRMVRFWLDLDGARELVVGLADMLGMGVVDVPVRSML